MNTVPKKKFDGANVPIAEQLSQPWCENRATTHNGLCEGCYMEEVARWID